MNAEEFDPYDDPADNNATARTLRLGAIVCIAVCVVFYGALWVLWGLVH